jgi:hypothetical protein
MELLQLIQHQHQPITMFHIWLLQVEGVELLHLIPIQVVAEVAEVLEKVKHQQHLIQVVL